MDKIIVTITGPSGAGKTLLTVVLYIFLRSMGYTVHSNIIPSDYSFIGCSDQLRGSEPTIYIKDGEDG